MKYIKNSFDKECFFDDLGKAKQYLIPDDDTMSEILDQENYLGDDFESFKHSFLEYVEELKSANDLETLVETYNRNSDDFSHGDRFEVVEI